MSYYLKLPINIRYCLGRKELLKFIWESKIWGALGMWKSNPLAAVYNASDGIIVYFREPPTFNTIGHECMHVVQFMVEQINETSRTIEFEAYMMGHIISNTVSQIRKAQWDKNLFEEE